jgi:hypothetical protein
MLETGELLIEGPFSLSLDGFYNAGPCLADYFLDPLRRRVKCSHVGIQVLCILGTGNTCRVMA